MDDPDVVPRAIFFFGSAKQHLLILGLENGEMYVQFF